MTWNKHLSDDVRLPAAEVRPGDVLVAAYLEGYDGESGFDPYSQEHPIKTIDFDKRHVIFNLANPIYIARGREVWIRARTGSPAIKASSDWNGTCGRCGKNTYTSCFSMEHEGECRT